MDDKNFDYLFKKQIQEDNLIPEKINQLFTNFEMEVEKMENKNNKTIENIKTRLTITYVIAWIIGIIGGCGIVYATIIPTEWKENLSNLINNYFGTEMSSEELNSGVQDKTVEEIIESDNKNAEKYSQLLDADVYDIGDSNGGTLIESNYKQYNFNAEYDEDETEIDLEKYSDTINIKMAMVNYGCLEKLDNENTVLDQEGNVIERKESSLEETVEYQYDELTQNWDEYYYGEEDFNEKLYYKITGMTLMNGNNKTDEDYYNFARAKKIKITFNNEQEEIVNLKDSPKAQFIDLSYVQNDISKPVQIEIEVLETYKGKVSNDAYIADIQFGMESNIPMGI